MRSYYLTFPCVTNGNDNRAAIIRTMRSITGHGLKETLDVILTGSHRMQVNNDFDLELKLRMLEQLGVSVELCSTVLRRYCIDHKGLPFFDPQGEFVDYRDYRELEQQLNNLKAQLRSLAG